MKWCIGESAHVAMGLEVPSCLLYDPWMLYYLYIIFLYIIDRSPMNSQPRSHAGMGADLGSQLFPKALNFL